MTQLKKPTFDEISAIIEEHDGARVGMAAAIFGLQQRCDAQPNTMQLQHDVATLARAARALNVALAKRVLAQQNAEMKEAGMADCWPAQQEWHELGHSSHCVFQQAARREAGIDHTPAFSVLLARYLGDDGEIDPTQARERVAAIPLPEEWDRLAKIVYEAMQEFADEGKRYPWVDGGNSNAQCSARIAVRRVYDSLRALTAAAPSPVPAITEAMIGEPLTADDWHEKAQQLAEENADLREKLRLISTGGSWCSEGPGYRGMRDGWWWSGPLVDHVGEPTFEQYLAELAAAEASDA